MEDNIFNNKMSPKPFIRPRIPTHFNSSNNNSNPSELDLYSRINLKIFISNRSPPLRIINHRDKFTPRKGHRLSCLFSKFRAINIINNNNR